MPTQAFLPVSLAVSCARGLGLDRTQKQRLPSTVITSMSSTHVGFGVCLWQASALRGKTLRLKPEIRKHSFRY